MELDLTHMAWPVSVLRCNEALNQLQPGDELILTVCDSGVMDTVLMLIKSQADLRFQQCKESESFRVMVHRVGGTEGSGAASHRGALHA